MQFLLWRSHRESNPEDEPASELLKRIQAEKAQLIKDGKLKKEKPLSPITEDEIPFDIPDTWQWVRLNICTPVLNGDRGKNYPAKSTLSKEGIPFISALNLDGKTVNPNKYEFATELFDSFVRPNLRRDNKGKILGYGIREVPSHSSFRERLEKIFEDAV